MKIAILGAGLIGRKRGIQLQGHTLEGVFDPDHGRGQAVAAELRTIAFGSEVELLQRSGAEIVIVATTNASLAPAATRAALAGKHVLVEKPGAIRLAELDLLEAAAGTQRVAVKVGFNHRFHPAILEARRLVDAGVLGPLMFMRVRYGHGGRLGYEKEWRAQPELAGGGELLDQGIHVLDLIHWFFGPLPLRSALVRTAFWDMAVDDNAVVTVGEDCARGRFATFHVSCSEWKNGFALELYGRTGKIRIEGLGGSYGKETLTVYRMKPEMGPPDVEVREFDGPDVSWAMDLANLVEHLTRGAPLLGSLESARYALSVVRDAYRWNGLSLPAAE